MAAASGVQFPIIVILSEGGCLAFNAGWKAADFVVNTASPAEVETRARVLSMGGLVNPGLMRSQTLQTMRRIPRLHHLETA